MTLRNFDRKPTDSPFTRREFLATAGSAALALGCSGSARKSRSSDKVDNVIVLGVDGMDPNLVRQYVKQGLMPNCARLIETGSFRALRTSDPPQSPVAWSNFITGTNPGGHGIFDFIARDPSTYMPYLSTSKTEAGGRPLKVGSWEIPLSAGKIRNLRHGPTFWNDLEQHGIDCTVFRIPANFPPSEGEATSLSGMGTPDLVGTYGEFTFYTNDPKQRTRSVSGGQIQRVVVKNQTVECKLLGPTNPFSSEKERATIPFHVYLDRERSLAKIAIDETSVVLRQGEWSDWVVVKFPMLPYVVDASGICRFLLKQVQDQFELYVSPINIDPANPSLPISNPPDYSKRLVRELGYFYTQGIVEDASALRANVLTATEYCQQSKFVLDERMRFFEHEFDRFRRGFFFYYFSSLDQNSHVFWRAIDPQHPLYNAELAKDYGEYIASLYAQIDRAIGLAMQRIDERTILMVMSDHGFTSFRRQFHLNSWLMDNGYCRASNPSGRSAINALVGVDWESTRAYGLGINSLYLNLQGRERNGIVKPGSAETSLCDALIEGLKGVRDPETGEQVISNVFRAKDIYNGPYVSDAPDLIVAYNNYYRASWDTVLGSFPKGLVSDNTDAWSGDHCVDSQFVPGVLLCNRPIKTEHPELQDLAPSILSEFGVPVPDGMTGRPIL